ncbi:hypothetical protein [Sphingomonas xanthus]|uniref:YCII-related domain-containing protein n=1 Tax=Sphingomonas xanthus TaxID=2594473 RepID=A0A516IT59_9SPHN|nr:hypothetical protein [Sphingomonas xanthus]QDP20079.1 hypothetical protein FMM02_09005 [Sphingomonas xanthus]
MRLIFALSCLVAAGVAVAQPTAAQDRPAAQRPVHLVVLTKAGPNFAKLGDMRSQALAHRDIYLDLTAKGEVIVSGPFVGEPVLGLTVFRQGVDEAAIRARLTNDAIIQAGVLEIEFRQWSIQMGGLPSPEGPTE